MSKEHDRDEEKLKRIANEIAMRGFTHLPDDSYVPSFPERTLLAAVLERAFRDLFDNDYAVVRDAIVWFRSKSRLDTCINFVDCVEILELSGSQMAYLTKCVQEASHGEFKAERQTGRAGAGALAGGSWHPGKKNPTVQWRGRVVRYN